MLEVSLAKGSSSPGDTRDGVAVFAQSFPFKSCSNSCVVKSLYASPCSDVFPTSSSSAASLRVSSMLFPSPDSACSLQRIPEPVFHGRLLLSPGVPTDKGEGVVGSTFLYSVRDLYRGLPHETFPLLHQL